MRVVLSYIHFPLALARYINLALLRRDDIELFTVGPYTGAWIPWAGGMELPKHANPPDLPLPASGQLPDVPITWVERQLPWRPDLWIHVDAGWHLKGKPEHGVNVFVGTDPHVLDYSAQRTLADVFFCMQTPYMAEGDKYLPYAYDPVFHAPEEQPRNYDAVLLGIHYEERNRLVEALREQGLDVFYGQGPIFEEARAIYNQAPLALAWSSKLDLCARVFEGAAMGRVVVTNRVPDLGRFFNEDTDLIAFSSLGEAVEKVMNCINNPAQIHHISAHARAAVEPHTWDSRIYQIIEGAGL